MKNEKGFGIWSIIKEEISKKKVFCADCCFCYSSANICVRGLCQTDKKHYCHGYKERNIDVEVFVPSHDDWW